MKIWGLGQISPEEKSDILSKHKSLYDGYRTMQPEVSNTQPLYVQDFANDKNGITVNNKGEVKQYTNMNINESENKEVCDECGSMMMEGECMECGWKGEVGDMEEGELDERFNKVKDWMKKPLSNDVEEYIKRVLDIIDDPKKKDDDEEIEIELDKKETDEGTGHLSDIHNVSDLNPNANFDYAEGGGNKFGTFEKMHNMKRIKSEGEYEDPDNEDDGFEDIGAYEEMDEQGYTGGGNAPDMDLSNIKPAYDFVSDGPMAGGDVYPTEEEMDEEWEKMESAWADDELEENDISGVQGMYLDMKKPYDFDSEGPGKAGPYQRSSYNEEEVEEELDEQGWASVARIAAPIAVNYLANKLNSEGEDEEDDDEFDPTDKSWEEITAHTGDDEFSHLDEDIKESFIIQKNKINEMMLRMKVIK